jgi:WD40 repeat protein
MERIETNNSTKYLISPRESFKHDAFISYSRSDEAFASKLERALEHYKPPRDLNLPHRYLRIFRDKEDFTAGDYDQNLRKHLVQSAKLIVLCSPYARGSEFVNEEIRSFVAARGAEHIIPLLISGIPNNKARPGQEREMAFPEALCEAMRMPLAVEYLGFYLDRDRINRGEFAAAWYMTLANIYDVDRSEIERREKKKDRQSRIVKPVLLVTIPVVLIGVLIWILITGREANQRQREAHAQSQLATLELRRSRQMQYVSDINAAHELAVAGRDIDSLELLIRYLHEDLRGFRGFEWYYLMAKYRNERATLKTNQENLFAVAFSPDGKTVASAGTQNARLWDVASGNEVVGLNGHTGEIRALAFSPDGKLVATGGDDKSIKLWDAASGNALRAFDGHTLRINSLAFSPDGKLLASGSRDDTVKLWNLASGRELVTFEGHTSQIPWLNKDDPAVELGGQRVAFSPDGKILASVGGVNLNLWDVGRRKHLGSIDLYVNDRRFFAFSPDGQRIAIADKDGSVEVYSVVLLEQQRRFNAHQSRVNALSFSPDGRMLATAGDDKTVKLWDVESRDQVATFIGHADSVQSISYSPDGKLIATAGRDGTVKLWDSPAAKLPDKLHQAGDVIKVAFLADSKMLAIVSSFSMITLWDVPSRSELGLPVTSTSRSTEFAFSLDGTTIAKLDYFGAIHLVDVASRLERQFPTKVSSVSKLALSPDAGILVTASAKNVTLWDVSSAKEIDSLELRPGNATIEDLLFSPEGNTVAIANSVGEIRLWNFKTDEQMTLKERTEYLYSVAFSPDGKTLASAGADANVKLWDVVSRKELTTLKGHTDDLKSVAFSADGNTLATTGLDGMIKLWHVATGRELLTLRGHENDNKWFNALAFSPDGQTLASGGLGRSVQLRDAPKRSDRELSFQLPVK